MAISIIGGLASSTLLTLLVVPVMFLLIAHFTTFVARLRMPQKIEQHPLGSEIEHDLATPMGRVDIK